MNKQQALEALLEVCRKQEEPGREVARVPHEEALLSLLEAARNLDVLVASPGSRRRTAGIRETLKLLGGLALYLLVDEVEVVEGRALEEWLNEGGADFDKRPMAERNGFAEPKPVNGSITGRQPIVVHYDAPPPPPVQVVVVPSRDGGYRYGGSRG